MRILVTGGAGFIGSHIVDLALRRGHHVAIIDDLSTGSADNLNPQATFHYIGLNDPGLPDILEQEAPDVVCHQAAQTNVTRSIRNPLDDARINIRGSISLLEACVQAGVRKMVYASSCAIYGNPAYLPVNEDHPANPVSPYGVSKFTVEKYLDVYRGVHGLAGTALRYSNVFGPRQSSEGEAGVVALFARRMLSGGQPVIYGAGDKTRSYVYVEDVALANLAAIESDCQGVYNIGGPEQTTDQAVFDSLKAALGYPGEARYTAVRPGEILHMALDGSKARRELGWSPRVGFLRGVSMASAFYRSQLGVVSRIAV